MNEKDFTALCKKVIVDYVNRHIDKSNRQEITEGDVYIVWLCKALGNSKAIMS